VAKTKKEEKSPGLFSHLDENGAARMVDVGGKEPTERQAVAIGEIELGEKILEAVVKQNVKKGDVLGVARVAGIMAAKKTSAVIPLCHNIGITGCEIDFSIDSPKHTLKVRCAVKTNNLTGVEMEALTGVTAALLTIYDMCKAIDKGMVIGGIKLLKKSGGKSGDFNLQFPG
jgi:cyclic pyranopterin phosphate synthase